jgi:hypothetical protein
MAHHFAPLRHFIVRAEEGFEWTDVLVVETEEDDLMTQETSPDYPMLSKRSSAIISRRMDEEAGSCVSGTSCFQPDDAELNAILAKYPDPKLSTSLTAWLTGKELPECSIVSITIGVAQTPMQAPSTEAPSGAKAGSEAGSETNSSGSGTVVADQPR